MQTLEHLKREAINSYNGVSFSPEKRGESIVNDYSNELDSDIETIKSIGANDAQVERYKSNYTSKLRGWLHSHGNIVSPMIAGPSNFPSARMRKRSEWADNHYSNFREWRTKVLNAYEKYQRKQRIADAGGELQIAKNNLASCEANAIIMVEANKIVRRALKNKETIGDAKIKLMAIGMNEENAGKILKPDFVGRFGFPSYAMQNNNANIKRLKERIATLEAKELRSGNENTVIPFEGGRIELNYSIDRLQIFNDIKPEHSKRKEYQHNGFKWSPSNGCWQRQLTSNAKYAAFKVTGIQVN